jgi:hypothetical protein
MAMPKRAPKTPPGELPASRYLRRGAVRNYFGIDDADFTKLLRAGVFTPHYFQGKGRAWFRRDQILAAEDEGKVFRPTKTPA